MPGAHSRARPIRASMTSSDSELPGGKRAGTAQRLAGDLFARDNVVDQTVAALPASQDQSSRARHVRGASPIVTGTDPPQNCWQPMVLNLPEMPDGAIRCPRRGKLL